MSQLSPLTPRHRWFELPAEWLLQWTSAGNWQARLSTSGLPEDIAGLIRAVVEKTGLMRYEKALVADELMGHFLDGQRFGHSLDELRQEFGQPEITAQLIRQSKLRNRPMLVRSLRVGVPLVALLAGGFFVLQAIFHAASPNPSVDYVAVLNQHIEEVPPEDRAWPVYRDAWAKFGFSEGGGMDWSSMHVEDAEGGMHLVRPEDESWPDAVAALERYDELMQAFRAGARRPKLGLPLQAKQANYSREDFEALFPNRDYDNIEEETVSGIDGAPVKPEIAKLLDGMTIGILLPHIQSFRTAARAFHVDTRLAVEQNDPERVVKNVETVLGLARQAGDHPFLVCGLVGIAVSQMALHEVEEVLKEHPDFLNEEQLERIQAAVADPKLKEMVDFGGEEAMMHDIVQRIYSDDGNGDGRMTPEGLEVLSIMSHTYIDNLSGPNGDLLDKVTRVAWGPITMFTEPSRKTVTEEYQALFDEMDTRFSLPFYLDDLSDWEGKIQQVAEENHLVGLLMPALQQVRHARDRNHAFLGGTELAVAAHRFRLEHDRWPNNEEELLDGWIERIPVDPITGKDLKFLINADDELIVYGLGCDGDDDGGKGVSLPYQFRTGDSAEDGDWVLYPNQHFSY